MTCGGVDLLNVINGYIASGKGGEEAQGGQETSNRLPNFLQRGTTQGPSNPQSKVIFGRFRQLLAINAHKMAPSTCQWLQVRVWDTLTKCLLWTTHTLSCWVSGDATPCRMTGATLHSRVRYKEIHISPQGSRFEFFIFEWGRARGGKNGETK